MLYGQSKQQTFKKVLGVYLPLNLLNYVTLYTLANDTNNRTLIEKMLKGFKAEKIEEGFTPEVLLKNFTTSLCKNMGLYAKEIEEFSCDSFISEVKKTITKRGLPSEQVEQIITELERYAKEEKTT